MMTRWGSPEGGITRGVPLTAVQTLMQFAEIEFSFLHKKLTVAIVSLHLEQSGGILLGDINFRALLLQNR
jgi:hypothetical protein